eukprot:2413983-Amphidinium_carterae.1
MTPHVPHPMCSMYCALCGSSTKCLESYPVILVRVESVPCPLSEKAKRSRSSTMYSTRMMKEE